MVQPAAPPSPLDSPEGRFEQEERATIPTNVIILGIAFMSHQSEHSGQALAGKPDERPPGLILQRAAGDSAGEIGRTDINQASHAILQDRNHPPGQSHLIFGSPDAFVGRPGREIVADAT